MTTTSFVLREQRRVAALQGLAQVYEHVVTGARHLHLATDETEIGFLVGFPTAPDSDNGCAHILEHTVLCGSKRYPVRDPFFSMMQRSVATFMNAMTYADRTVYPFATTDPVDFANLLDVYLDAAFFPRLERLSFLQEGWRAELHDGRCSLHGVVFNEMKDNYAQPGRLLYMGMNRLLFSGTTYGVDSGGDPLAIPNLSYEALRAFHATFYHPSQAVFMSSGSIDPAFVQSRIEDSVMAHFRERQTRLLPGLAASWSAPRKDVITLPAGSGSGADEHGLQLAWRFDSVATVDDKLRLSALIQLLAGHDAAPVPQAIRALGYGRPATLMGPDFSARQAVMHLGVSGLRTDQLDSAQMAVMETLNSLVRDGLPQETLDGVLRQMRFSQRQQMPTFRRLVGVADAALRDESLLDAIDLEPALARLGAMMREPGFLQNEVRQLLDCPNHLQVHVQPDAQFASARDAREKALIACHEVAMDESARQNVAVETAALAAHQSKPENGADVLPRILPSDLSRQPQPMRKVQIDVNGNVVAAAATQGLSQVDIVIDVSAVNADDAPWLALLSRLLPDLGAGGMASAQALAWRETQVQSFAADFRSRIRVDGRLQVELVLSASALREDQEALAPVLSAWLTSPDLADIVHLRSLIARDAQSQLANLPGRAQEMVRLSLLAPLQAVAAYEESYHGLASLSFLGNLKRMLANDTEFGVVQVKLQELLKQVNEAPRQCVCAAMEDDVQALADSLVANLPAPRARLMAETGAAEAFLARSEEFTGDAKPGMALRVPVQVNSCLLAWQVPKHSSPQAPALAVAAQLLTQQFLHPAVRERGGAYGVHARYDGHAGVFSMGSSADPRLSGTYTDFAKALHDLQHTVVTREAVENAILSVIKGLDRPQLPLERIQLAWEAWRRGVQEHEREAFRAGVLDCQLEDVRHVVAEFLAAKPACRAAVAASALRTPELDGLHAVDLLRLAQDAGCLDQAELTA